MDTRSSPFKSPALWLAALLAISQAVNAIRVLLDPIGYATYMGLPTTDVGFVYVYGLRTAFIAALVTCFLLLRNVAALKWMALAALIMPLGDALLTLEAGASTGIVARHFVIALFVVVTYLFLRVEVARPGTPGVR